MLSASALVQATHRFSTVGQLAQVQVIDRHSGQALPVYWHRGEYWIAGLPGAKYSISVRNTSGQRLLAVMSVDGLNVLTGQTADFSQPGYVFANGQRYAVEGWRKSDHEVAAFVFTDSGDSYAERIGKPRDMGVIGLALFREQPAVMHSPALSSHPVRPRSEKQESQESQPRAAPAPSSAPSSLESHLLPDAAKRAAPAHPPRLGTAHGEREISYVTRTQFLRASHQPDEIIRIRYDNHANLKAMGIIVRPQPVPSPSPNPFPESSWGYVPDPPALWR